MTERIAVVGLGSIGSKHVDTLLSLGHTDVVAIDSRPMPQEERVPVVDQFEDLFRWKPTHALICSPPEFHYHHAKYFLDRGIHTFIEKPMTHTGAEAHLLCQLAHEKGAMLAVGYMERAHPVVLEAKDWARKHRPSFAEFFCYWRATEKTYKLNTLEESSHAIDTALFVMGEAAACKRRGGVDARACVEISYQSARAEIVMDMWADPRRRIQMYGAGEFFSRDYGTKSDEWSACYRAELEAFLSGKPLCAGADGMAVVDVLEAVR
jgi:predicted dehydrogenase